MWNLLVLDRLPCNGEVVRERHGVAANKNGDDRIVVSHLSQSKIYRGSSRMKIQFCSPSEHADSEILRVVRNNELREKIVEKYSWQ